jgi:hypothetical protein
MLVEVYSLFFFKVFPDKFKNSSLFFTYYSRFIASSHTYDTNISLQLRKTHEGTSEKQALIASSIWWQFLIPLMVSNQIFWFPTCTDIMLDPVRPVPRLAYTWYTRYAGNWISSCRQVYVGEVGPLERVGKTSSFQRAQLSRILSLLSLDDGNISNFRNVIRIKYISYNGQVQHNIVLARRIKNLTDI